MKTRTVMFEVEKTTKNTVKFNEVPANGEPPIIGALYTQKWFAGTGTKARVTIEIAESPTETFKP